MHEQVVRPCLEALSRPGFDTANAEMMKAHEAYRRGEFADAITDAGAAFESVLKTICQRRGWSFDPDRDTCSKLVSICRENGLFHPFYVPLLDATGTIRNKIGDAHGHGPTERYVVRKEHADHMIRLASTNIALMIELSGL